MAFRRRHSILDMFFRYKKLIGDELRARCENSRRVESVIACNILNQFRLLGSSHVRWLHEDQIKRSVLSM
jgi:hypothetical protein